jgi:tetratricopeptide (TPR) repeat protein
VGFVLGVAVLVSLASALWQTHVARQHAARADTVRDFVVDLLRQTAPTGPASERPDVPALVYEAAAKLPTALHDQPLVRAELLVTLGNVLRNMNDPQRSEGLLRLAREDLDVAGIDDRLRLEADVGMARTLNRLSRYEEAKATLLPWLALPERRLPFEARRATLLKLAMAIDAGAGRTEDALRLGSEMIDAYERDCARGIACDELGYAQYDYGMTLVGASRLTQGRALLQASLSSKRAARVPLPSIADSLFGLSLIHGLQGDLDPAEAFAREAMGLQQSLGDSVRTPLQAAQHQLAEVLLAKGDHAQALQLLSELLDRPRNKGTGDCAIATTMLYSAIARIERAQHEAALSEATNARRGATSCPPGNRLLVAETADLIAARASLASGVAPAARAAIDAARVNEVVSRRAGPGRQLTYLAQALRLSVELDDAALTRAVAGHLVGLLNTIDASPASPLRVEAELVQSRAQGADPATVAEHFEPLLRRIEDWPVGQRLNRQWLAWRASGRLSAS